MAKSNPHTGRRFDDLVKEEGIYNEVQARALKRAPAEQIGEGMQAASLTKTAMASKMSTSRSQLDRVLEPDNLSIQLDTLIKAARAVGKVVEIDATRGKRVTRIDVLGASTFTSSTSAATGVVALSSR